ncbi:MAG: DUF3572 domain-containing protein [Neomegalonema sp.]|nr:DUF3572 domain-containing protein [Neomegalonema sp.]
MMMMTVDAAAELGSSALLFLAERPDDIGAFLAETGASISDLRGGAEEPQILGFLLAYIAAREELAEAFCVSNNIGPEQLAGAQAALLGQETHWT